MKNIEVSDEMHDFLMELSKEINTQDNRATAKPYFFQIRTQEEVHVAEGCGTKCWHYDGSKIVTEDEINETIAEYKELNVENIEGLPDYEKEEILEDAGWQKANFDYKDEYQNAFLTAKACKEHIRLNHYHYHEPVDYLTHAFRNPELEMVLKFICGLTNKEVTQ